MFGLTLVGCTLGSEALRWSAPAAAPQSYVVSCTPYTPNGATLYPAGFGYFPRAYDGTTAGATAFVTANPGCWQTVPDGSSPTTTTTHPVTTTTTSPATTTTTKPAKNRKAWCARHLKYVGPRCPGHH